jgi:heme-degrading monooxygenase HmoA/predicted O-methyltransferase YrrM
MDNHATEMRSYYRKRAVSYDQVYLYPERQSDLRFLEIHIPHQFKDLKVLEIAAGTGYWSQFIIGQAASLLATDVTAETLVRIKQRCLSRPIQTRVVDAFSLNEVGTHFNGAFAGLWFSHIKKQQIPDFLTSLHACLQPGSRVIFLDNAEWLGASNTEEFSRQRATDTGHSRFCYQSQLPGAGEFLAISICSEIRTFDQEPSMILEVAILDVKKARQHAFEQAFQRAQSIIVTMEGYVSHQLQRCIEKDNRYILLVNWETLEHHTEGFRQSASYQQWRELLHHFYDPFPEVEHYKAVY